MIASGATNRKVLVRQKKVKPAETVVEEEQDFGPVGFGNISHWGFNDYSSRYNGWEPTQPRSVESLKERINNILSMDRGFLQTPIWDPF